MDVDERIRGLLEQYPSPPAGDGRALYERGRRRRRTRRVTSVAAGALVVAAIAVAGVQLGSTDELPMPVIGGLPELDEVPARSPACAQLATDTAEVVVEVAEHAVGQAGGLPGEVVATEHDDVWELAGQLAAGDPQLEAAVTDLAARRQQHGCELGFAYPEVAERTRQQVERHRETLATGTDAETHAAMNLLVVLAAEFAPPTDRQPVPDGIPVTFPVHPDAVLVSHAAHDRRATATWQLTGADLEEVSNLYNEWLTEPLPADGWNVPSSEEQRTHHLDGTITGRARLEITGYGTTGHLYIETHQTPDTIEITLNLEHDR